MVGADEGAPMFDWDGAARAHAAAQERAWDEQMYANHDEWLQNSWGGWAVRTIRGFAGNSFFQAVADSLNDQDGEQTATSIILTNGARLAVILAMILMTLAVGYVMQMIVGQDIVVEQEVIVQEEIRESDKEDDEKDQEDAGEENESPREGVVTRRGAKDRKKEHK
uniref:Uncharacterized protein n=1 Tax=Minutocellus polymorphus TaxID=265543 RepID=A0A7S0FUY3_9STRA|mmetsp:Transcript_9694/g.16085  ORF Transcript_9694/g.16085 Transcript_9694/m.16085 type:complete len:166 (+) Transcript_9694:100-597(+)